LVSKLKHGLLAQNWPVVCPAAMSSPEIRKTCIHVSDETTQLCASASKEETIVWPMFHSQKVTRHASTSLDEKVPSNARINILIRRWWKKTQMRCDANC